MKRKELQDTKTKSVEELKKLEMDTREALRKLKFDFMAKKLQNVRAIRGKRKELAQILTLTRNK